MNGYLASWKRNAHPKNTGRIGQADSENLRSRPRDLSQAPREISILAFIEGDEVIMNILKCPEGNLS